MNEIVVVVGPAGIERAAVHKSVEITGEFQAVEMTSLSARGGPRVEWGRVACILHLAGGESHRPLIRPGGRTDGLELLHLLVETGSTPGAWLMDGLRQGAAAVLSWPCLATDLRAALNAARQGAAYHTPRAGGLLVGRIRDGCRQPVWELILTPRQLEVSRQIRAGRTNKEIATVLGIAESTVECHLTQIYRTIGAQSRAGAVVRLTENAHTKVPPGLLTPVEQQVIRGILQGRGNDDIADRLRVSRHTIETHLTHAYRKLRVRNRLQLMSRCLVLPTNPAPIQKTGAGPIRQYSPMDTAGVARASRLRQEPSRRHFPQSNHANE
jgi:DNA-binding NarL/FixJ family response regulator